MRLEDRIAIVTGGVRGIGAATAKRFLEEGAIVEIWEVANVEEETLSSVAGNAPSGRLSAKYVDVSNAASVREGMDTILARHGRVDVLVNNAGVIADGFASDLSLEAWETVINVNLTGTFLCCQAALPAMREQKSGVILNTSSISALGNKGQANYAASKAGVIGLTRTIALEVAADQVRVNAVAPGTIDTEMFRQVPAKVREKFLSRIPLGRLGRPEDVANLHLFLASDEAAYITGQTIFCDGGLRL